MSPIENKRRGGSSSKSASPTIDDDHSSDERSRPGMAIFDRNFRRQQRAGRRRRRFTPQRRSEVAGVRKIGACMECRQKKISCKHALERISRVASPTFSTSSRNIDSFKAEHSDIYLGNNSTTLPQPEVEVEHLPSVMDSIVSNDSMEWMLRTVPAAGKHLDRIALEIHDFDASFGDPSTSIDDLSHSIPDWRSFPYDSSSEPEMQLSELSSRSDYLLFSPLSPTSSTASEGDSNFANPIAADVFRCDVQGCDFRHGFALKFDLRCHQESKHPHIFPPYVTFPCPVDGCRQQVWPFVSKDKLEEHKRLNHPEFVQNKVLDIVDTENIDPLGLGKKYQFEQYLAGMSNDLVVFPQRNPVPGENPPWRQRDGKITTSSRGGVHRAPPRRQADVAQNFVGQRWIPQTLAPPQNIESNWVNNTVLSPPNDMRSPYTVEPSPYVQGNPPAQPSPAQFGSPAGDTNFSFQPENPYFQHPPQFYGPPPAPPGPVNHQPMYPDRYTSGSMFPQQGFVNPYEVQNGYPSAPSRQGPEIQVQHSSFLENEAFSGTSSSFMPLPNQSPSLHFNPQANPYLDQQSWPMDQTPQYTGMQTLPVNNNSRLSIDGTNSISDTYEVISHHDSPSFTFSSYSSENRRPSAASLHPLVTQDYSLRPSPPLLEPSGAISTSSEASLYTLVEHPMTGVLGLDINDWEGLPMKSDAENTAGGMAFYGLASQHDVAMPRDMTHQ